MASNNVHIVTGMEAIINPENIKPGMTTFDLKKLEKSMIDGGLITNHVKEPQDKFYDDLADAAKKLGISFDDVPPTQSTPNINKYANINKYEELPSATMDAIDDTYHSTSSTHDLPTYNHSSRDNNSTHNHSSPRRVEEDDDDDDDEPVRNYVEPPNYGNSLQERTIEQQKRSHIDSIVGGSDMINNFSFEQEKKEDLKCAMLAEIDNLLDSLLEENVDLSRIPTVNSNSEYKEVESVLKMLRHKNDHTRYCVFAEELLIFGAYGLEELFDGKNVYLGRYSPDVTGWHNHLNVKIKRMKIDTSQVVSTVMSHYNIGPIARILLELIPNIVLYSKMRSQQHSEPGLFSQESMQADTQNIRNL